MRRILSTLCIALGLALLALAVNNYRYDREQLRTWQRTTAYVDEAGVARVGRTPYRPWHPGGWAPRLRTHWEADGQELAAWVVDPMRARRSRQEALAEGRAAVAAASHTLLVDPADPMHTSSHYDQPWRYYADMWQNALPGALLLLVGIAARRGARATPGAAAGVAQRA